MRTKLKRAIRRVEGHDHWKFANNILYGLCNKHPDHRTPDIVMAKIWLIGRSYAAAIERGRKDAAKGDRFYIKQVGPKISKSGIDDWIAAVRSHRKGSQARFEEALITHAKATELFKEISSQEKRSLASKYLHFHVPDAFFIFDSRACAAIRQLSELLGRVSVEAIGVDKEYATFAMKCRKLQALIKATFGANFSTREIDRVLLEIADSWYLNLTA
jgi:hypothetical protein